MLCFTCALISLNFCEGTKCMISWNFCEGTKCMISLNFCEGTKCMIGYTDVFPSFLQSEVY